MQALENTHKKKDLRKVVARGVINGGKKPDSFRGSESVGGPEVVVKGVHMEQRSVSHRIDVTVIATNCSLLPRKHAQHQVKRPLGCLIHTQ